MGRGAVGIVEIYSVPRIDRRRVQGFRIHVVYGGVIQDVTRIRSSASEVSRGLSCRTDGIFHDVPIGVYERRVLYGIPFVRVGRIETGKHDFSRISIGSPFGNGARIACKGSGERFGRDRFPMSSEDVRG